MFKARSVFGVMGLCNVVPVYERQNYQDVLFWTLDEYDKEKEERKRRRNHTGAHDNNTGRKNTSWYVVDERGCLVNYSTIELVRKTARSLFVDLHLRGLAPAKWDQAGFTARNYYEFHMITMFPCLGWCEQNYKVHKIAQEVYPGWYKNHILRKSDGGDEDDEIKAEDVINIIPVDGSSPSSSLAISSPESIALPPKRPASPTPLSDTRSPQRQRVSEEMPTSATSTPTAQTVSEDKTTFTPSSTVNTNNAPPATTDAGILDTAVSVSVSEVPLVQATVMSFLNITVLVILIDDIVVC